jgi:hypothetical protein
MVHLLYEIGIGPHRRFRGRGELEDRLMDARRLLDEKALRKLVEKLEKKLDKR